VIGRLARDAADRRDVRDHGVTTPIRPVVAPKFVNPTRNVARAARGDARSRIW
jgi:hypothetical protein